MEEDSVVSLRSTLIKNGGLLDQIYVIESEHNPHIKSFNKKYVVIEGNSRLCIFKEQLKNTKYKTFTVKEILLNKSDQTWVIELIKHAASYLSEGIVNVNSLLGIKNFIIGGSIGLNNTFFNEIKSQTKIITSEKIIFKKAKLKNNAEVFGCLAYSSLQNLGLK